MNRKVLKTAIIICWVVLAVCFIIKIFGGKYFEIATNNDTFNTVCEYVDNNLWLQNILSFITNLLTVILLNLAVLKQKILRGKQFLIVIICTTITFVIVAMGYMLDNQTLSTIGFFASVLPFCICPMILSKKPLRSIFAYVLYVAFQAISVAIKGLALTKINEDSTLIALIYGIDLYIMLILYCLYANLRKDNCKNKINEKENKNG